MALRVFQLRADQMPNAGYAAVGLLNALIGSCSFATDGTGDITVKVVHGLVADQLVRFSVQGGALPPQLDFNGQYFVLAVGLTTTKLRVSLTSGGAPILFT